jgi:hypothetical protein
MKTNNLLLTVLALYTPFHIAFVANPVLRKLFGIHDRHPEMADNVFYWMITCQFWAMAAAPLLLIILLMTYRLAVQTK